jgi:hypothetical protein
MTPTGQPAPETSTTRFRHRQVPMNQLPLHLPPDQPAEGDCPSIAEQCPRISWEFGSMAISWNPQLAVRMGSPLTRVIGRIGKPARTLRNRLSVARQ